jgi:hypothetical protein
MALSPSGKALLGAHCGSGQDTAVGICSRGKSGLHWTDSADQELENYWEETPSLGTLISHNGFNKILAGGKTDQLACREEF